MFLEDRRLRIAKAPIPKKPAPVSERGNGGEIRPPLAGGLGVSFSKATFFVNHKKLTFRNKFLLRTKKARRTGLSG
jgi:hypothetical protein